MIHLIDYKINPCLGCYSKSPKLCRYPCVQKDDMQKIYPLLIKADAIVFGTPVYWFNMSGLLSCRSKHSPHDTQNNNYSKNYCNSYANLL
ncbi:MAG: flavodoxin family protein [Candidatus Micrarchaeia archaeon]